MSRKSCTDTSNKKFPLKTLRTLEKSRVLGWVASLPPNHGASNRTPLYNCERLYLFFNVSCDTSIRNIVARSLGALRVAPCFFLLVTFLHPPPAAEADEPVNSRRGVNAVSTGERAVQRCQRKERGCKKTAEKNDDCK